MLRIVFVLGVVVVGPAFAGDLASPDATARRLAAEEAGRKKSADAAPRLAALLADENPEVREEAFIALARLGDAATGPLVEVLKGGKPVAQGAALRLLVRLGTKAEPAVPAAAKLLETAELSQKIDAAYLLETIGPVAKGAKSALFRAATDTENQGAIFKMRGGPESASACEAAVSALLAIDPEAGPEWVKKCLPVLLAKLDPKDSGVVAAVCRSIARVGPPAKEALPSLRAFSRKLRGSDGLGYEITRAVAALDPASANVRAGESDRAAVQRVLKRIADDPEGVSLLAAQIQERDTIGQRIAAKALITLGPKAAKAAPAVARVLADIETDTPLRKLASEAIVSFGKAAVPELVKTLASDRVSVRLIALDVLSRLGRRAASAAEAVAGRLKDDSPVVRSVAASTYLKIGGSWDRVAVAVKADLSSDDPETRQAALMACVGIGRPAAACGPRLLELLGDDDATVRTFAVMALGRTRALPDKATPRLAALYDRTKAEIVVEALKSYGPEAKAAVPTLIRSLDAKETFGVISPYRVLEPIGPGAEAAVPALVRIVEKGDWNNRVAPVETLGAIGPGAKAAVPALVAGLGRIRTNDDWARTARALGLIGPAASAALPALDEQARAADRRKRIAAVTASALIRNEPKSAVPELIELWDESLLFGWGFGRAHGFDLAQAFGDLGEAAVPARDRLFKAMADPAAPLGTRSRAGRALARIPSQAEAIRPKLVALVGETRIARFERDDLPLIDTLVALRPSAEELAALEKLAAGDEPAAAELAGRVLRAIADR